MGRSVVRGTEAGQGALIDFDGKIYCSLSKKNQEDNAASLSASK
jgi:hypothetical protein